jgi:alpha-galactosidase
MLAAARASALLLVLAAPAARAGFNGMARTPPMSWRSWNQFGCNVSQPDISAASRALVDRSRTVDGVPTSLFDLGYVTVGLDDCYQGLTPTSGCTYPGYGSDALAFELEAEGGAAAAAAPPRGPPYTQHDDNGRPLINRTRFPDLLALTAEAHALGLQAGFYQVNCFCRDHCGSEACFLGDTDAMLDYDFDQVKYDSCGGEVGNITFFAQLLNRSSKAATTVIENCNNDNTPDGSVPLDQLPYHLYRTSYDIRPTYGSIASNAQTVLGNTAAVSGPGAWAYPDMLEVGVTMQVLTARRPVAREHAAAVERALREPLPPVLTFVEARTHFAIWSALSSPLTLTNNLTDQAGMDAVWPIIANREAIAVNQAWAGHPGDLLAQAADKVLLLHCVPIWAGDRNCSLPSWQSFAKPLPGGAAAVVVANHGFDALSTSINLTAVPGLACAAGACSVRDVHAHKDLGAFSGSVPVGPLASHDSAFYVIS